MGLFDMGGGFDLSGLADYLNPIGGASAAVNPPLPDTSAIGNIGGLTPEALRAAGAGGEVNPSPVPPGGVPLPRPNPLQPSPAELAGAVTLNRGLTPPPEPVPPPTPQEPSVGAALMGTGSGVGPTGPTLPGKEGGSTDVSAQAKKPEDRMANLATALKGVQAPKSPEIQKISSPNAPRPTGTIKAGDLQALLLALNAGAGMGGKLPVTLGGRA